MPAGGDDRQAEIPWLKWLPSSPVANRATSTMLAIAGRNWRSPGSRVLGIRVVEVGTGAPVSVQTATVKLATTVALSEFTRSLWRPDYRRNMEWMQLLQSELAEQKRPGDVEAYREFMERHPDARPNPLGCVAPLALTTVATLAPMFWSPLNQTLHERLAGIVVVED